MLVSDPGRRSLCAVAALGGLAGGGALLVLPAVAGAELPGVGLSVSATGAGVGGQRSVPRRVEIVSEASLGPVETAWSSRRSEEFVPNLPTQLVDFARENLGERFGGLYFWRAHGRKPVLVLRLKDPGERDRRLIEFALSNRELAFIKAPVRIVAVRYSERELGVIRDRLVRDLGDNAAGIGLDLARNQVVATVDAQPRVKNRYRTGSRAERPGEAALRRRIRVRKGTIRWQDGERPELHAYPSGVYADTAILISRGGGAWSGCTTAFAFVSDTRYILTAGHCGNVGDPAMESANPATFATPYGPQFGHIATKHVGAFGDMAAVYSPNALGRVFMDAANTFYVTGSGDPQPGEWTCFRGATSGTRCGNVGQTGLTMTPAGINVAVGNQFCINVGSDHGDSGSAMWAQESGDVWSHKRVRARGILSSGNAAMTCGTPVSVPMAAWGGTIVTDQPPGTPQPPVICC